jgi:hypothetical protein
MYNVTHNMNINSQTVHLTSRERCYYAVSDKKIYYVETVKFNKNNKEFEYISTGEIEIIESNKYSLK